MPTVLIVDDDTDIVAMLVQVLQDEGYAVVTGTGDEALALAESAAPSVVLLDIMMPGIDGVEFARRLRANPGTATLPIVAMSASHRLRERAGQMQVDDLLAKPFDLDDLLAAIQRLLRRVANTGPVSDSPGVAPPSL
ncbi:MAG: response regulator transcription factor [Chloroflexi bacterium]|nr:response regulator transcription factor [Chloroflexota bacterium]